MTQYEQTEDRKILRVRETRVIDIKAVPEFFLRLSNDVTLRFTGTVWCRVGGRGRNEVPRPLSELTTEQLAAGIAARPLSWVVFNDGAQRIVLSNRWHLTFEPGPGDSWTLQLSDGTTFVHPSR